MNQEETARRELTKEEIAENKRLENKLRNVYDEETKTLDMSKQRVTDLKTNTRIFPPKPASGSKEMLIQLQRDTVVKTAKNFIEN